MRMVAFDFRNSALYDFEIMMPPTRVLGIGKWQIWTMLWVTMICWQTCLLAGRFERAILSVVIMISRQIGYVGSQGKRQAQ